MREIKAHRTGGPLNEALRVEADGDKYHVSAKAHGQWQKKWTLEFQGDRICTDETGGPAGLSEELLLALVLDRLTQDDADTGMARVKLREALFWLGRATSDK